MSTLAMKRQGRGLLMRAAWGGECGEDFGALGRWRRRRSRGAGGRVLVGAAGR